MLRLGHRYSRIAGQLTYHLVAASRCKRFLLIVRSELSSYTRGIFKLG
jgi:hypothetical protein